MEPVNPIRFKNPEQNEFVKTLRKRVDAYFKDNNLRKSGGTRLKLKAVVMLLMYTVPYFIIIFSVFDSMFLNWLMAIGMGFGMAGIGFSVMHDANHGAFSRKKWLNKFLGFSLNFLGGNVNNWKAQHNIMHHTYTNIDGYDEDIKPNGILRFSPDTEKKPIHRFQYIYAWFFYGLMTLSWTFSKDFGDAFRYNEMGLYKQLKTTFRKEMTLIIVTRLVYFFYMIAIPLMVTDLTVVQLILGFLTIHFVAGVVLASIFQLAHVMEETKYPKPVEGSILNQWAVHQMQTTLNFAQNNKVLSWFVGGLNYQIEHHLFPNISHIHYRKIAPIVKKTALEYKIPYFSQGTFFSALKDHGRMLYKLGNA